MSAIQTPELAQPRSDWRARLEQWLNSNRVQQSIIALIVLNAVILGLETSDSLMADWGVLLHRLDNLILLVFVLELSLRLVAQGLRLLRDPWGIFDLLVVGIALVPASGPFAVLRALRVLRVLRLVSANPNMRKIVGALLSALPGMGNIAMLLGLIFYVAAVMANQLFGDAFPEWFGSLGASVYTLFQVMTLESWSMGIVRPVMVEFPLAWMFFLPFILIATFMMLNLFIAVIVNALQTTHEPSEQERAALVREQALFEELQHLRQDIQALRDSLPPRG